MASGDQRTKLEEQRSEILRESLAVARKMFEGSRAPGDAGLYFTYYSQEAEILRQKQSILLRKLCILDDILKDKKPKQ